MAPLWPCLPDTDGLFCVRPVHLHFIETWAGGYWFEICASSWLASILICFMHFFTVLQCTTMQRFRTNTHPPIQSIQFSFNQFQSRSSPSKPLKIHQTWEYGFPKTGSQNSFYRMLCTPPRAPSHESMFHPGFGSQI